MRSFNLAMLGIVALSSLALGQALEPGARVGLESRTLGADTRTGVIISSSADSLIVQPDRSRTVARLARTDVSSVEVSVGHHRNAGRGAIVGLLVGVVGGAAIGAMTWEPCNGFCFLEPDTRASSAALGAGVFGILGTVLGTIAGALDVTDEWRSVSIKPDVALVRGGGGTFGLKMSHSF